MISLNNITFEFGGRALYREANWHIKPNERIGLIGMNGTGKSTLLRMIYGEYKPNEGSISKPKDLTIGFLNQDQLSFETDSSILQVTMSAFQRQLDLEVEIEKVLKIMETDYSDEVLNKLSDLQTEFDALDGYNIHHKCEKVLEGLGFSTAQLHQPYKKFSGGWRMRVMLAKLLLQNPKLLMLDEPTNHLDLPTIEWLENYLQSYEGTVIVVSHDREFLDKMINKTVEVAGQKITEYSGNYSFYLSAKDERADLQQRQFDNQQQFIKQQEAFINRFKAKASKATAAQSRVKLLDKLDRIEAPEDDNREININFKMSTQSGKVVVEVDHATKAFSPEVRIVTNAVAKIERGDKIALIGANGKGKSTLLRMIANVEPFEGTITRGHNVVEAFYAQHQLESLNVENEILQEMQQYAGERTDTELRTLLGCFLFTGDEVFKKIKVLSGGEKARVALSRTLLAEANFMLLDEPTNHLDIRSINILTQAMQQYQGTFIVVSHDRFFVSQVANKIWYIENEEIKEYPGTFAEYEFWRKKQEDEKLKAEKLQPKTAKVEKPAVVVKEEKPKQPSNKNQIQQLQKSISGIEQQIDTIKKELAKLEEQFTNTELMKDLNKAQELQKQYDGQKKRLTETEQEYETVFLQLMELEAQ